MPCIEAGASHEVRFHEHHRDNERGHEPVKRRRCEPGALAAKCAGVSARLIAVTHMMKPLMTKNRSTPAAPSLPKECPLSPYTCAIEW